MNLKSSKLHLVSLQELKNGLDTEHFIKTLTETETAIRTKRKPSLLIYQKTYCLCNQIKKFVITVSSMIYT